MKSWCLYSSLYQDLSSNKVSGGYALDKIMIDGQTNELGRTKRQLYAVHSGGINKMEKYRIGIKVVLYFIHKHTVNILYKPKSNLVKHVYFFQKIITWKYITLVLDWAIQLNANIFTKTQYVRCELPVWLSKKQKVLHYKLLKCKMGI